MNEYTEILSHVKETNKKIDELFDYERKHAIRSENFSLRIQAAEDCLNKLPCDTSHTAWDAVVKKVDRHVIHINIQWVLLTSILFSILGMAFFLIRSNLI